MSRDDPFGLRSDPARTRIRPVGHRPAQRPAEEPAAWPDGARAHPWPPLGAGGTMGGASLDQPRANDNSLVVAFAGLLSLAPELERASIPENPEVLRARLGEALVRARDAAIGRGVEPPRAEEAAWFVAALLDDVALNTPWGGASGWPARPLVAAMGGGVDAGERFFNRLDELIRHPERNPEMLELAHHCLALGFRGKHRVSGAAGVGALEQLRAQVARVLRRREEVVPLAPHWEGVAAPDERPRLVVPTWSAFVLAAALLTGLYVLLATRLSDQGESLYAIAETLPPPERAAVHRPVRNTGVEIPPPPEPIVIELYPALREAAPEPLRGALEGQDDVSLTTLSIQADDPEVFRSARAEVNPVYVPLVATIAGVLAENIDNISGVTVIGHTDSERVSRTNPFVTNQGLSEARAETIADLLAAGGVPADRITAEGRGAEEPIATNETREGKARNRRVEIRIEKRI